MAWDDSLVDQYKKDSLMKALGGLSPQSQLPDDEETFDPASVGTSDSVLRGDDGSESLTHAPAKLGDEWYGSDDPFDPAAVQNLEEKISRISMGPGNIGGGALAGMARMPEDALFSRIRDMRGDPQFSGILKNMIGDNPRNKNSAAVDALRIINDSAAGETPASIGDNIGGYYNSPEDRIRDNLHSLSIMADGNSGGYRKVDTPGRMSQSVYNALSKMFDAPNVNPDNPINSFVKSMMDPDTRLSLNTAPKSEYQPGQLNPEASPVSDMVDEIRKYYPTAIIPNGDGRAGVIRTYKKHFGLPIDRDHALTSYEGPVNLALPDKSLLEDDDITKGW